MKMFITFATLGMCLLIIPCAAVAQTEGAAAIARETHARQAEQQLPVLPPRVVRPPLVTDAIVRERMPPRVADGLVPTPVTDRLPPAVITPPGGVVQSVVTARPVVPATAVPATAVPATAVPATAVPVTGQVTALDTFSRMRYGYYDDGLVDNNWFYDYYELPAATAVQPATKSAPGYRTSWRYEPAAEQRLFRW